MLFNSIKTRITVSIIGIVFISLTITTVFLEQKFKKELTKAIDENAQNLLQATMHQVESQYNSILYQKSAMLARRKVELKNNLTIAFAIVKSNYRQFKNGQISEDTAKKNALYDLEQLRYNKNYGYFWVNDTTVPHPKMLMHATMPNLNNTILDSPTFNCAYGKKKNLFKAFVDVCLEKNEGYVNYLWPKPTSNGFTSQQPKLSYVKLFKPWSWIVGTGVYLDDINYDVQKRVNAVIKDLNATLVKQKIGKDGYSFIFNGENIIIVHPTLAGTDGTSFINSVSNNKLIDDLKLIALTSNRSIEYMWNKGNSKNEHAFVKKAYVTYYEPLDWYICSTIYKDEFEKKILDLNNTIFIFSIVFIILALLISIIISKSITNPLSNLVNAMRERDKNGIPRNTISVTGTSETQELGIAINNMINAIKKTGTELINQRDFYINISNHAPFIICALTLDDIIIFINSTGEKITGYSQSEILGKHWRQLFNSIHIQDQIEIKSQIDTNNQVEIFLKRFKEETVVDCEINLTCKNGEQKTIVWSNFIRKDKNNNISEVIAFGHDITLQKRTQTMLVQTEKMLSVGGLAAGMAHEINNPLGIIMGFAQTITRRLSLNLKKNVVVAEKIGIDLEKVEKYMQERGIPTYLTGIQEAGMRATKIVRNMLEFSRKSESTKKQCDLHNLLDKAIELASNDYDLKKRFDFRSIEVRRQYDEELPMVVVLETEIEQVFLNLFKNAAQAMEDKQYSDYSPQIIIKTYRKDDWICIEIEDNGPGMNIKISKRVFEPFFTTKEVGSGTGLGLSVSYFIITNTHGGEFFVESKENIGTKFVIHIPGEKFE